MNKTFSKYAGVDLFRDYLLLTNPASKNPLFSKTGRRMFPKWNVEISDVQWDITAASLKQRIHTAYLLGWVHAVLGVAMSVPVVTSFESTKISYIVGIVVGNILLNGYPILVQIQIHDRCMKILKRKSKKPHA